MIEETKNQLAMKLLLFNTSSILRSLKELEPMHEQVIKMRFGIGDTDHTLEEIEKQFNVSRKRIKEIETGCVDSLLKSSGLLAKTIARVSTDLQQLRQPKLTEEEKLLESIFGKRNTGL